MVNHPDTFTLAAKWVIINLPFVVIKLADRHGFLLSFCLVKIWFVNFQLQLL